MSSLTSILVPTPTGKPAPFPFPGIPDVPDIADRNCRLLGPFSLFVQAIMGFVVLGTLVLKRQREKPKRPWKIWTLDISKQMLGQLFVHTLNVILSSLGSIASEGANNPCSLYFLNIAIDTTIGVLFIYFSMRFLTHYFTDVLGWPGFVSGQYTAVPTVLGRRRRPRRPNEPSFDTSYDASHDEVMTSPVTSEPPHHLHNSLNNLQTSTASPDIHVTKKQRPRLSFFFRQLSLYLLSLLLMKIMVVILFALFPFLFDVGRWVLNLFGKHQKAQIFFVMAVFPLGMNTLQFWLIDSLLRHNPLTSIYKSEEDAEVAGANEEGQQNQTRSSWWRRNSRSFQGESESRSRLMGSEDNDDSSRDDHRLEENHAYPPTPSAGSSVGQLDAHAKATNESDGGNYGATVKSPALNPQKGAVEVEPTASSQKRLSRSNEEEEEAEEEEEDVWDNWKEDSKPNESAKQDF